MVFLTLFVSGAAVQQQELDGPTPIGKVVTLINDLKAELEGELQKETAVFSDFLENFCVQQEDSLKGSIQEDENGIESNQAGFDNEKANVERLTVDVAKTNKSIDETEADKAARTRAFEKARETYTRVEADLSKAISGLKGAIKHVSSSQSFLSLSTEAKAAVRKNVDLAVALGLGNSKAVASFLQGPGDYEFHSGGILEILQNLEKEFTDKKAEVDADFDATKLEWNEKRAALVNKLEALNDTLTTKTEELDQATENKGTHEYNLAQLNKDKDHDSAYLKDLQTRCAAKQKQWTQRKQGREDEIEAVTTALGILQGDVEGRANEVNKRALLQKSTNAFVSRHIVTPSIVNLKENDLSSFVSFLQTAKVSSGVEAARKIVSDKAKELQSEVLLELSDKITAEGKFDKVKKLIQKLIERLLSEAAAEATSQGNCETKVTAATNKRDSRAAQVTEVNAHLGKLEAFRMQLENDIDRLEGELDTLRTTLQKDTDNRNKEKEDNLEAIKTAEEGLEALENAIQVLDLYYHGKHKVGGADTARVLIQKTNPLDETAEWQSVGGTEGAYQGAQGKSKGIFGLLQTIRSDFIRTIRTTKEDEKESQAEFRVSSRENRGTTTSKDTEKNHKENDLQVTKSKIVESNDELKNQMELVATAVKELEILWPLCVSVDMDFADRKAKIEKEIEALKAANQALQPQP